jgi:hypothetical protein
MRFSFLLLAAAALPLAAQDVPVSPAEEPQATRPGGGFRRVDEPPRAAAPIDTRPTFLPNQVVIPAGTMISLHVNDLVSSDRNQPGDAFTASLAQPIVADGFVVARRGQLVAGRVAEAVRAGRAKGTSRLAIEFTEVQVADGRQVAMVTQLIQYAGGTSKGRDATALGAGAGLGAMIGAAANGGMGAGAGAGAGLAAAAVGVLLTRGRATEVWPEATLTLRLTSPVTIDTARAPHAFLQVRQEDFEPQRQTLQRRTAQTGPGWNSPRIWGGPGIWLSNGPGWGPGWGGGGWGRRGWGRGWGGGPGWWW